MRNIRSLGIGVFLLAVTTTAAVGAQSANDKAAAEALFDEGKRLMDAKRYTEACPKLADSQRLDPGVGTLLNLALCYKSNGQTASAWSTYREAASEARAARQEDRETLARDEAAALEKSLTRLVIEVSPAAAAISGLEVKRDGAPVPRGLWGVPAPVDPGVRRIDVTAPGKKPLHLDARTEGAGATAKVVIPALEEGDPGAAPAAVAAPMAAANPTTDPAPASPTDTSTAPPPSDDSGSSSGSGQRIGGFVLGGVGALAITGGVIVGLLSMAQAKVADQASSSAKRADYNDRASTTATIAYISVGGGVAALIGGIVLIATAPSKKPKTASTFTLTPELGPHEFGARLVGRF